MLQFMKDYWLAWVVTLIVFIVSFLEIPFLTELGVLLLSIVWTVLVARVATPKAAVATPAPVAVSAPVSKGISIACADESLQSVVADYDDTIKHEVSVVNEELMQVKELIAESIETLNNSFSSLYEHTQAEYDVIRSLLENLGGDESSDEMSVQKFSAEIKVVLQYLIGLLTNSSQRS